MDTAKVTRKLLPTLAAAALAGCGSLDSGKRAEPRTALLDLRITEIHYHPADQGEIPGDEYEFIEIQNAGEDELDLTDVGFTDGIEYAFTKGTSIGAGEFLVLAADAARFEERYGFEPHGTYEGGLSNSGETVILEDIPAGAVIAQVTYADGGTWPTVADGGGPSLVPLSASADGTAGSWRPSFRAHGSPGRSDAGAVIINEISSHTDPPLKDAIELYNPNEAPMDIGGWYLSDKKSEPAKFRIPDGTTIPAKGYLVFDKDDFNADSSATGSFNLGAHGDDAWVFADSGGCPAGYCHGFEFGEIENGVTFGRHVTSIGEEHFVAQKAPSLGSANEGPRVGPVVISEIMYHPANDTDEYLEIANVGGVQVDLFDRDNPDNTWRIKGYAFAFPTGVTLEPGEVALVLSAEASEDRIKSALGAPSDVKIFRATGGLNNAADTLSLLKPGEPFVETSSAGADTTVVPYILIDRVTYSDGNPWPQEADGDGPALIRKQLKEYGDDPANWSAAEATPGRVPSD
jgi:hypothetical protein